ncbi:MAG: hypothetical protein Q8M15_15065 [Bacteroidota bacterium]|nr:hypothetical protein [Bacteroidota bacterium]
MKTKMIIIAIIALAGISLLTAFKQTAVPKQYLTLTVSTLSSKQFIVDENGNVDEKKFLSVVSNSDGCSQLTRSINNIASKGYKLSGTLMLTTNNNGNAIQYIFEKE